MGDNEGFFIHCGYCYFIQDHTSRGRDAEREPEKRDVKIACKYVSGGNTTERSRTVSKLTNKCLQIYEQCCTTGYDAKVCELIIQS